MSTLTIDVNELPARLQEALTAARAGTEVVITDAATPVVKLLQAASAPPAKREWIFNMHPGAMVMREDFCDHIDEEAFLRGDI